MKTLYRSIRSVLRRAIRLRGTGVDAPPLPESGAKGYDRVICSTAALRSWTSGQPGLLNRSTHSRSAVQYKCTIVEIRQALHKTRWGAVSVKAAARAKSSDRQARIAAAKKSGRTRGISSIKLLVVVDATVASKRTLQYVGRLAAGRKGPELYLAYIAPHLPPELLEFGGAARPEREERLESNLRRQQRGWMAVGDRKAERILRAAEATLLQAGVAAPRIHTCVSSPLDAINAADEVLLLARDQQCGTVVVGHRAHSWFRGLGGGDLADQLVRRAKGDAVWVIG